MKTLQQLLQLDPLVMRPEELSIAKEQLTARKREVESQYRIKEFLEIMHPVDSLIAQISDRLDAIDNDR